MLSSARPRNLGWLGAAGLLFGDWGTSRLYVLGLAFVVAGRSSLVLIGFMSLLVLMVAWAYTHICRIYPDGGGVYTAGRQRARVLGVIGALLLLADYTVTASMSALDGFHYFGLGKHDTPAAQVESYQKPDVGSGLILQHDDGPQEAEPLWKLNSPGLWAIVSIFAIGAVNLLGPKHSAGYAVLTALGMVGITLLVAGAAVFKMDWGHLELGTLRHDPKTLWISLTYVVLALSGVEAIANLTGVMKKPVFETSRKAIWPVAVEVAFFNLLLCLAMLSLAGTMTREEYKEDMLAHMAKSFLGAFGEVPVRIVGGLLLLSATNTAVGAIGSILYVMSRDGELPEVFQKLNRFGAPWVAVLVATVIPASVLLFAHDISTLASLYAIGVVGAVAINCILCATHPRLPSSWRHVAMGALGCLLIALWVTLAGTKFHALVFVSIVMGVGLLARQVNFAYKKRQGDKPSLLRKAIYEQLTPEALMAPKVLIGTYGSTHLAIPALREAKREGATLVVCFIREINLSYKIDPAKLTLDTDPAAVRTFARFLDLAHGEGVKILPVYDTGPDAAILLAENAAIQGCSKILIGSSRHGALYRLIKGQFQRRIESLLPPEIPVEVVVPETTGEPATA
jgi:amino acid transporter